MSFLDDLRRSPFEAERGSNGELIGKPVLLLWESDFSRLVMETYERPYDLQQQGDMMGQDTAFTFEVPDTWGDGEWDGMSGPTFSEWSTVEVGEPPRYHPDGSYNHDWSTWYLHWTRDYYPMRGAVVNDLHRRGLLPAGNYVMHVWW